MPFALVALGASGLTQVSPTQVLQPSHYRSPSGRYELRVEPSAFQGAGPATYELLLDGERLWRAELSYTFQEAVCTDTGHAAGYAYTHGSNPYRAEGDFVVAVLGRNGEELVRDMESREPSRGPDGDPSPLGLGVLWQPVQDRIVVRVADPDFNRASEAWWVYSASSGRRHRRIHPREDFDLPAGLWSCRDARTVRGTRFTLVWFRRWEPALGAWFGLLDGDGEVVWQLDLPDGDATRSTLHLPPTESALLGVDRPGHFAIRDLAAGERVEYRVEPTRDRKGWTASEVGREPFRPTNDPSSPPR